MGAKQPQEPPKGSHSGPLPPPPPKKKLTLQEAFDRAAELYGKAQARRRFARGLNKQMEDDEAVKLYRIASLIKQWSEKQGHDACWYYPEIFRQIADICEVEVAVPEVHSRTEMEAGCKRYLDELFAFSPLQSVITWIPVSERLPDVERPVLLGNYGDDTPRYGWKSRNTSGWSLGADFRPLHEFSLWADLPAPPASEEGEG